MFEKSVAAAKEFATRFIVARILEIFNFKERVIFQHFQFLKIPEMRCCKEERNGNKQASFCKKLAVKTSRAQCATGFNILLFFSAEKPFKPREKSSVLKRVLFF